MKLAISLAVIIIKGLIAIGDFVIFLFRLPFLALRACFRLLKKGITTFLHIPFDKPIRNIRAKLFTLQAKRSKTLLENKKVKQKKPFTLKLPSTKPIALFLAKPFLAIGRFFKQVFTAAPPKIRLKKLKRVRKKRVNISPLSFFIKFRYFIAGIVFSFIFFFLPLLVVVFLQDLPSPKSLSIGQIPQTTKLYDRHGTLLYQIYGGQNRTSVPLAEVPKSLQNATIATEDKDFYSHPGFDLLAITRSVVGNISGHDLQGGSTITQQLIKSALLSPETSLSRKFKEAVLAFWAERMYTKKQILEMYFNQIPYGGTSWGVEAAAQTYFGKHVKDLDLAESAFLAGIPRAPTIYSPFGSSPNAWKKRQKEVLYRMQTLGYISKTEEKKATQEHLTFEQPQTPLHAPHFVMYIRDLLVKRYGLPMVEKGGLNVITSLDLPLQEDAQKIVADEVKNDEYLHLTNGAALITNPRNGDILAMIGSKNYADPQDGAYNVATALRQPGSSIKVLTYSAALSNGLTAASILDDSPITFSSPGGPAYSPVNYDGKFHGRVPLRIAFANSFNVTAVKTLNQIGVPTMVNLGKQMGISSWGDPKNYGLSITLGAAEASMTDMATVYGTVANSGRRVDLNPFLKVTDYKGTVLEEKKETDGEQVLDPGVAYIVSSILADNQARAIEFGTNSPLVIPGRTVSVKTGTSDEKKDNWTIGYTPSRVVAVWVGNNDNSPMSQTLASGITGAAPIWNKLMQRILTGIPDEAPTMPENIVQKPCLGRTEFFLRGTENTVNCSSPRQASPTPSQTH